MNQRRQSQQLDDEASNATAVNKPKVSPLTDPLTRKGQTGERTGRRADMRTSRRRRRLNEHSLLTPTAASILVATKSKRQATKSGD